jgi:hypothetical protein
MVGGEIQYDLAYYAPLGEKFLRMSCLAKRKSMRDDRLDLALLKQVQ